MKHNKKNNHLSRKYSHRISMLSNMACSLIIYKSIYTTLAKAKILKKYIEPILNILKNKNLNTRRTILKKIKNKKVIDILYKIILKKIKNRKGGYVRILKAGHRKGDSSKMSIIQLVDFYEYEKI